MSDRKQQLGLSVTRIGVSRDMRHLRETVKNLMALPAQLRPDRKGEDLKEPFAGSIEQEMIAGWSGEGQGHRCVRP